MENKDKEVIDLKHIIIYYINNWKVFIVAFVFSLILAILYLLLYPKTYEIYSSVQIQDEKSLMSSGSFGLGEAAGLMKSFGLGGISSGGISMDDELKIFESNDLMNKAVLELGLNIEYSEPLSFGYKLYNTSPIKITADSTVMNMLDNKIEFQVVNNKGAIKVKVKTDDRSEKFQFTGLPAIIPTVYGDFILENASVNQNISAFKINITVQPSRWAAEDILDDIIIDDYSKMSNIVELTWRDHEKQRGVDLLTALVNHYNERADIIKQEEGEKSLQFLDGRIQNVIVDLNDIENTIEDYKIKNQLTNIEFDIQFYIEQARDLRVKIIELEAQLHAINMMDNYVKDTTNRYNLVPVLLTVQEGEKGSAISTYNEALIERARILKNSSPENPLVEALNTQVDQLRNSVYLTIDNARQSLLLTLNDLKSKEEAVFSRIGDVPSQERLYIEYKRQQEIFQGLYLILLQKREEIALATGVDKPKAQIVDAAYVKKKPVAPRKLYAAIAIFLLTLVIPIGYLFFQEQFTSLYRAYKEDRKRQRN